jgi:P27 family predicted phage terminase small subunit
MPNPPKPSALKILQGNPGKRPLNGNEPKPSGVPTCPDGLSKGARKEWKRISKELIACSLLTRVDRAGLAIYCETYARWEHATEQVNKYGVMVKDPSDLSGKRAMPNPYLSIAEKAAETVRKLLPEFGLSPSGRSRLQITAAPEAPASEWDDFDNLKAMPSATQ